MLQMPTIKLMRPIVRVRLRDPSPVIRDTGHESRAPEPVLCASGPVTHATDHESRDPSDELARLLTTVNRLAESLGKVYEETLACHHGQIARLAVEIARKILMYKVDKGDYAIQAIVEEALQQAPTRQNVVVRLRPEDLAECQRLQREDPQSPFAQLELAADGSLGRGECLVQTPQGIVTSFIEEHLVRIREALQKVEG